MTLFSYDILRVLATVAVVWLHVSMYAVLYNEPLSFAWWVGNVSDAAVRWCVPVFVLVSGGLLLGPRDESPLEFYRKRLKRLLVPLLFWSGLYLSLKFALHLTTRHDAALSLWHGRPHYHLWYLYMAFGLYLVTPVLRHFLAIASVTVRTWTTFVLLASSIAGMAIVYVRGWELPFFLLFLPYVGYYLLGYHLAQMPIRASAGMLWALLIAGIVAAAWGAGLYGQYAYAYVGVPALMMSTAVYSLGLQLPVSPPPLPTPLARGLALLSRASLGIYLVHPLFLEALERIFGLEPWRRTPLITIPAYTVLVCAASAGIALVLLGLPYLRRTVGGST
ncbi:MAG: acyltransferase family protein [FCB group bacterium]|jgi:surface polysaccharide O-acyltransferase-like enzyme|nr:acyltransferase family protein [FCB group bacterium]